MLEECAILQQLGLLLINLNLTITFIMLKRQAHTYHQMLQSYSYQSNAICHSFGILEHGHISSLFAELDHQQIRALHPAISHHQTKPHKQQHEQADNRGEQTRRKKELPTRQSNRERACHDRNGEGKSRGLWSRYFNWPSQVRTPYSQLRKEWDENAEQYEKQFQTQIKTVFQISQQSGKNNTQEQQYTDEPSDENEEILHQLKTSKKQNPDLFNGHSNQLLIKFNPGNSRLLDAPKKSKRYRRIYNRESSQEQVPTHSACLLKVKPYESVNNCSQHSSELVH